MHQSWRSYPIFYKTLILRSLSSVCWWKASRFLFGTLCHHETLQRAWFVWNHPLFWEFDIFYLVCINRYLIPRCIYYGYPPSDDLFIWYLFFTWFFFVIWYRFLKVLSMHINLMQYFQHAFFLGPNIQGKLHQVSNWMRCV